MSQTDERTVRPRLEGQLLNDLEELRSPGQSYVGAIKEAVKFYKSIEPVEVNEQK
jgi:hypothetical protein